MVISTVCQCNEATIVSLNSSLLNRITLFDIKHLLYDYALKIDYDREVYVQQKGEQEYRKICVIEQRLCIELIKLVGLHFYRIKYMYFLYNYRLIDTNQD